VIVEGLYLFLVSDAVSEYWRRLGDLFDEKWYLDVSLETARDR
jgi:pantothenate kinase